MQELLIYLIALPIAYLANTKEVNNERKISKTNQCQINRYKGAMVMINILKGLPILILANALLGAELGRLKEQFSKEILISGLFKGFIIYASIGLVVLAVDILPPFDVVFNGTQMDLLSVINLLLLGELGYYGTNVALKFTNLMKHKREQAETLIDDTLEDDGGVG